ncbi:hypothetical protein [Bacillus bombysepticus]|uniref:hypothetical protein n=1 Tax=Bacillus bombysepticus TaxID=658666 RepID=UPI003017B68D
MLLKTHFGQSPKRNTTDSAGYDVYADHKFIIKKGESYKWTLPFLIQGEKSAFIVVRSSLGIKKGLRLIDQDSKMSNEILWSKPNKPLTLHLFNDSEEDLAIKTGEHIVQCIIPSSVKSVIPIIWNKVQQQSLKGTVPLHSRLQQRPKEIYDYIVEEIIHIPAKEKVLIPTGLKAWIPIQTYLTAYLIDEKLMFANVRPIIDADYHNNSDNEGHIFLCIQNTSDTPITISPGESLCYFEASGYSIIKNEIKPVTKRTGGIGHTTK